MNTVSASTADEWRTWLAAHARTEREVWLVIHHKDSGIPSVRIAEAVEHALCFGWIDGLHRKRDANSSQLRFTPRRPASTWSAVNRERVARLTALDLMTPAGQAMVDHAKETGRWEVVVPADVRDLLDGHAGFRALPPSARRLALEWISTAKRPETRQRRIEKTLARLP